MAQIMQRLNFTWMGEVGYDASTKHTFRVVVALLAAYTVYALALEIIEGDKTMYEIPPFIAPMKFVGGVLFTIWSIWSLMKTRENVRAKYSIPEEQCVGYEDLCCSAFCSCCVVAQMGRHTGEFETYRGSCCSTTGLAMGAPAIV